MQKSERVFSVREVNEDINRKLKKEGNIRILGEITLISEPESGHWYFCLKDQHAKINAAIFRNHQQDIDFKPEPGDVVEASGHVDLYVEKGKFQVVIESMRLIKRNEVQPQKETTINQEAIRTTPQHPLPSPLPGVNQERKSILGRWWLLLAGFFLLILILGLRRLVWVTCGLYNHATV